MAFEWESLLLWAGALANASSLIACFFHLRGQGFDHYLRAQRLAAAAAALYGGGLAVLLVEFLLPDLRVAYVFEHTSTGTALAYRVAGLWGGHEGTLLVWALAAATAVAVNARVWQRRMDRGESPPVDERHPLPWTLLVGEAVALGLALVALATEPFRRTPGWETALQPAGRGLQPILHTPFMVIHPPLQFVFYGLAVLPFAAAVAHLATGRPEWADVALPWTRLAVLVSWIGLGLGALWAYYVLNFGGYWAWDPVETGNLLAFLTLIPLLHGLIYYRKKRAMHVVAVLFGLLVVPATLASTLSTRSGLWVSVHAFTDPSQAFERDPLLRLLNILDASPLLRHLASLLIVAVAGALFAYVAHLRRGAGPAARTALLAAGTVVGATAAVAVVDPRVPVGLLFTLAQRIPGSTSAGLLVLGGVAAVLLALPALVAGGPEPHDERPWMERWLTMGVLVHVGMVLVGAAVLVLALLSLADVNGYDRTTYDDRAPFVALPILLVLGVALSNQAVGRRASLALAALALLLGVALPVVFPAHWRLWLALPALLFALLAALVKTFNASNGPETPSALRWAGGLLLVGGVAALVYWANPPSLLLGRIPASPWLVVLGVPLALLAMAGGVAALARRNLRVAYLGSLALAASLAWGAAPLGGLLAAVLVHRGRAAFVGGRDAWDLRGSAKALRREVRKTGTYLVHVAVVLGMLGFAASTYAMGADETVRLAPGASATAHGYTFEFQGSAARDVDPASGEPNDVAVRVAVREGTSERGVLEVHLWRAFPAFYAERVAVDRLDLEDVYVLPTVVETSDQGQSRSWVPHEDGVHLTKDVRVTALTVTVRTLPGMHLVWGGLWTGVAGLVGLLLAGGLAFEPAPRRSREGRADNG